MKIESSAVIQRPIQEVFDVVATKWSAKDDEFMNIYGYLEVPT
jgi:hypothetical protein